MSQLSVFASAYATTPSGATSLDHFIDQIRSGFYAKPVAKVRAGEMDKRGLPAVTFSGTFSVRSSAGLISHSGLLQIDIDAKDNPGRDMPALRDALIERDPHVVATFISAGGLGLKVVIPIDGSRHKESADAAAVYFKVIHDLTIDPACKDIPRLCFVSDDPGAKIKHNLADIRQLALPKPNIDTSSERPAPVSVSEGPGSEPVTPLGSKIFAFTSPEHEKAAIDRVDEVLSFIPPRPDYPEWLRILSGVFDELPFHHAVSSLNQWSPEESENEYERKFPVRLKEIGFGTVVKIAASHGFDNSPEKIIERAVAKLPILESELPDSATDDPDISGGPSSGGPSSGGSSGGPDGDDISPGPGGTSGTAPAPKSKPKSRITRLPDHIVAVRKTPHFVDGVLMPNGFSLWYGRTNKGKSFLVQDLAAAIASGRHWRNGEVEIIGHGPVVYCALEGGFGSENRILALKAKGLLKDGDPFGLVTVPVRLLEKGIKRGAMVICDAIKEMQDDFGRAVKFIVIDTWARATAGGGEENSNSDALMGVAQCDEVRTAAAHAGLAAVHHAGKDETKGARGASSLPDACDTEIEIYRPDGSDISTAIVRKQRDMEFRPPMPFRLEQVQVGVDHRGRPVTSCVVVHLRSEEGTVRGSASGSKRVPRIPAHQILGLLPQSSSDAWMRECESKFGISRATFYREFKKLKEAGRCEVKADGSIILIGDIFGFSGGNGDENSSDEH